MWLIKVNHIMWYINIIFIFCFRWIKMVTKYINDLFIGFYNIFKTFKCKIKIQKIKHAAYIKHIGRWLFNYIAILEHNIIITIYLIFKLYRGLEYYKIIELYNFNYIYVFDVNFVC